MKKLLLIKVGSDVLFKDSILAQNFDALNTIFSNYQDYKKILIVSGSIEFGASLLKYKKSSLGALACIGQTALYKYYEDYLVQKGAKSAQCLITQSNLTITSFLSNIELVINDLLDHEYIPIINTNDLITSSDEHLNDNFVLTGLLTETFKAEEVMIIHGNRHSDKLNSFNAQFGDLKGISTFFVS